MIFYLSIKAAKRLFTQAGAPVVSVEIEEKLRRSAGISYRNVSFAFGDSQVVMMSVKATGDIFQVKLNGKVLALARASVSLPAPVKTAAPRMLEQLRVVLADKLEALELAKEWLVTLQNLHLLR